VNRKYKSADNWESEARQNPRPKISFPVTSSYISIVVMSTETQKYMTFVSNPMGNQRVRDVPGIGSVTAAKMAEK